MTGESPQAFLKFLEEPPPDTYLILVTEQPQRLPPTILSRCRKLAAPLASPEEGRAWLAAQGVASPELVLAQTGGAPLAALFCADPVVQSERRAWIASLSRPAELSAPVLAARIEAGGRDERCRMDRGHGARG